MNASMCQHAVSESETGQKQDCLFGSPELLHPGDSASTGENRQQRVLILSKTLQAVVCIPFTSELRHIRFQYSKCHWTAGFSVCSSNALPGRLGTCLRCRGVPRWSADSNTCAALEVCQSEACCLAHDDSAITGRGGPGLGLHSLDLHLDLRQLLPPGSIASHA